MGHTSLLPDTPDGLPEVPVFTHWAPIGGGSSEAYEASVEKYKVEVALLTSGQDLKPLERPTETSFLTPTFQRTWYYGQPTSLALCRGEEMAGAKEQTPLSCLSLHYRNPYLKLGPFKYEPLSADPHIAILRDFYSPAECSGFVSRSRGRVHSTPYQTATTTEYFTSQRSSKRLHLMEEEFQPAAESSSRISLATGWVVGQEEAASDPYSVINYGLGGQIEVHVDYWSEENKRAGGARVATFLGYLTEVEEGGRTVFPALGLAVRPERGSALFWMTVRPREEYDSR